MPTDLFSPRRVALLTAILTVLSFNSCSDTSSGVSTGLIVNPLPPGNDFSIMLSVKNTSGQPVSGLDVSAWGIVSYPGKPAKSQASPSQIQATSTINFQLPVESRVRLEVRDLTDSLMSVLIDNHELPAGVFAYQWSPSHWLVVNDSTAIMDRAIPNGIYKIRLTAVNLGEPSRTYREQQYAVLMDEGNPMLFSVPGFSIGSVEQGEFVTTDPAVFPGTYSVFPDIPFTRDDPTVLGKVTITNRALIVLSDRVTGKYQKYEVEISPHRNFLPLTWFPEHSVPVVSASHHQSSSLEKKAGRILSDEIPTTFKLYPNYPNPFN